MPDAKTVELQGLGPQSKAVITPDAPEGLRVDVHKVTPGTVVPVTMWTNVSDLAIHIGSQVGFAAGTQLVLSLQHQDWSSLGPAAAFMPLAAMIVAEAWNTFSGWLKAH